MNGAAGLQTGRVRADLQVGPSIASFCNALSVPAQSPRGVEPRTGPEGELDAKFPYLLADRVGEGRCVGEPQVTGQRVEHLALRALDGRMAGDVRAVRPT